MTAYSWLSGRAQVCHKTGIFYRKALTPRHAYIQFKVKESTSTYKSRILIVANPFLPAKKRYLKLVRPFSGHWTDQYNQKRCSWVEHFAVSKQQLPNFRHAKKPKFLTNELCPLDFYLLLSRLPSSWMMEQEFHWNFWVNLTRFLAFFPGLFDWIMLIWVWFRNLFSSPCAN